MYLKYLKIPQSKHNTIHSLTPWCRVLLEQLTGLQLVKKFPAFHGTRRFITALTSVRHMSLSLDQPNPVHIPTSHLLEIRPNIIHTSTPRSPQLSLSLRFLHQDPIPLPLLTHTFHMPSQRLVNTRHMPSQRLVNTRHMPSQRLVNILRIKCVPKLALFTNYRISVYQS